jgi:hypothetical protein
MKNSDQSTNELIVSFSTMTDIDEIALDNNLKKITLKNITLKSQPIFPDDLEEINLYSVKLPEKITKFSSKLKNLSIKYLSPFNQLPELPEGLLSLKIHSGTFNFRDINDRLPDSIEYLEFEFCTDLTIFPNILPVNLKTLLIRQNYSSCDNLTRLPEGLEHLDLSESSYKNLPDPLPVGLKTLILKNCPNLSEFPPLPAGMEHLDLSECKDLTSLPNPLPSSLKTLILKNCSNLTKLPPLPAGIEHLDLSGCKGLMSLPNPLPANLKNINLNSCSSLIDLPKLPEGTQHVNLALCYSFKTLLGPLPKSLKTLDLENCIGINQLPELPDNIEYLGLSSYENKNLPNKLPTNLKILILSHYLDLVTLSELPAGLKTLKISNCLDLVTLSELPAGLKTLEISNCPIKILKQLPKTIENLELILDNVEELDLTDCRLLKKLPNKLSANLKTLNLSNCFSLENLPTLPDSIKILNLTGCTSLKEISRFPANVEGIYLENCTSLNLSFDNVKQLLDLNDYNRYIISNPNFEITWPEHFYKSPKVNIIKEVIRQAYRDHYQSDEHWGRIEPQPHKENFPTFFLLDRYLNQKIIERGGISEIVESADKFSQEISKKSGLLEITDQHSRFYLDACVNQPVAGFFEIANLTNIDSYSTIPEKLEKCKVLMALNSIIYNVKNFKSTNQESVGVALEAELVNALMSEVHRKLLEEKIITQEWPAIPVMITFVSLIEPFLTQENINKASEIIKNQVLNASPIEVAEFMCEGHFSNFWLNQILTKEQINEVMKPYSDMVEEISEIDDEEELESKAVELQNTKISCEEKLFKTAKEISFASITELDIDRAELAIKKLESDIEKFKERKFTDKQEEGQISTSPNPSLAQNNLSETLMRIHRPASLERLSP